MVKGLKKLRRKLAKIPQSTKERLQADIMVEGRGLNVDQRGLAPRDDGILVSTIQTNPIGGDKIGAIVKAGGPATTRSVGDGLSAQYDYALGQEFGNENTPAKPFFYFPFRAKKRSIKGKITRGIKKAIKTVL